jgi:hypothetical protein
MDNPQNIIYLNSDASEVEASEVEVSEESDNGNDSAMETLFDTQKIKIIVEAKSIDALTARLRNGEVDLFTSFQRKGNLWKDDVKSRLIESLLLRFPLPAFYFDISNDDKWLVVDGLQRLSTIKSFVLDGMPLKGLEILTNRDPEKGEVFIGKTFDDLSRPMQRRISETQITCHLILDGTPKEVKYNVFKRINTGGLGLTPMEIRHALNQKGNALNCLKAITGEMANLEDDSLTPTVFNKLIKIKNERMEGREMALRYIAFSLKSYEDYEPTFSTFLDKAMERLDKLENWSILVEKLEQALELSHFLFEQHLFSRSIIEPNLKSKLNSALFEVWTVTLSNLSDMEQDIIRKNKDALIASYKILLSESEFVKSVVSSTAGKKSVFTRFSSIETLVNKYKHA